MVKPEKKFAKHRKEIQNFIVTISMNYLFTIIVTTIITTTIINIIINHIQLYLFE